MEKSRAIELLKLAVPIKALTQQEYSDFIEAVNMGMDALKTQLLQKGATKGTTSDLISRQAAIDLLKQMRKDGDMVPWEGKNVFARIRKLPSAQPEPQEGHWIWVVGDLECSKCHTRYPDLYPDYDNSVACPHCGARMKGEQNETN